ncbi:3533_t:CDS:2 [Entrophospora sp. SA101]|nr:3533_t:CDS:2 [Entrophospora sp. SA101]
MATTEEIKQELKNAKKLRTSGKGGRCIRIFAKLIISLLVKDIDRSASDRVKRIQHIASTFVLQQNWVEELDNDPVF